jgi:hypothetical protein
MAGSLFVLNLRAGCGNVPLVGRCFLLWCRPRRDSSGSAVIADPVDGNVVDDRLVVDVVNVGDVYVVDGAVVVEGSISPFPTVVTAAGITEAVVNTAIETHRRAPITDVPDEGRSAPSPVSGCP